MKDRTMAYIFLVSLWLVLLSQIYFTLGNRAIAKVNQTYIRVTNCFLATTPNDRTREYVTACYVKAEKATGVKVDHYGK